MNSRIAHYPLILTVFLVSSFSREACAADTKKLTPKDMYYLGRSIAYWPEGAACFAHEMGHAATAKALLKKSPIEMHLGRHLKEFSQEELAAHKPGVWVHGFDFSQGFSTIRGRRSASKNQNRIIDIAGPVAGIAVSAGLLLLMNKIKSNNRGITLLIEASKHVATIEVLHQFIFGFTPLYQNKDDDGYRVWKSFDVSDDTLETIAKFDQKRRTLNFCNNVIRLSSLYALKEKLSS